MGWGCGFADFDNDGWLDIFQCNGHSYPEVDRLQSGETFHQRRIVYRNLTNGVFQDVSPDAGSCIMERYASRGCAFGDFDNDGDIDVLVSNINDVPSLLRADLKSGHHWIKVQVTGKTSNRSGIGTRIKCVTGNHQQIDEVRSGGSLMSQSDLRVHFGLGNGEHCGSAGNSLAQRQCGNPAQHCGRPADLRRRRQGNYANAQTAIVTLRHRDGPGYAERAGLRQRWPACIPQSRFVVQWQEYKMGKAVATRACAPMIVPPFRRAVNTGPCEWPGQEAKSVSSPEP